MGKELLAMGAQFAAFMLISEGIGWVIGKAEELWNMVPTKNHIRQWADEAAASLQQTQQELSTLTDQLQTLQSRIHELESKDTLTLIEEAELDRLKQENFELEKKVALLREQERLEREASASSNVESLHTFDDSKSFTPADANSRGDLKTFSLPDTLKYYREQIQSLNEALPTMTPGNADYENTEKRLKNMTKEYDELVNSIRQYSVAVEDVSEDEKAYVKAINGEINLHDIEKGFFKPLDYIYANLSDAEWEEFNNKFREMASTGEITSITIGKAFGSSFSKVKDLMLELGYAEGDWAEGLEADVKTFQNIDGIIDELSQQDGFSSVKSKIEELASSSDEMTAENILSIFGEDFVDALNDSGVSINELILWLKDMQNNVDQFSAASPIGEFKSYEETLGSLTNAVEEFKNTSGDVSTSTLDGISEAFSSLGDAKELDNLLDVLGNSSSSIDEVKTAMDALVDVYLDQEAALGHLTEANKEQYASQLEQLGLSNAQQIVTEKLTKKKSELGAATTEETAAIQDNINAVSNLGLASITTAQQLDFFAACRKIDSGGNFSKVVSEHTNSLLAVAVAAGAAGTALSEYLTLTGEITSIEERIDKNKGSNPHDKKLLKEKKKQAAAIEDKAKASMKGIKDSLSSLLPTTPTGTTTTGGSTTKTKKTAAEERKDSYDVRKAKLDYWLELNKISYENYYNRLKALGKEYLVNQKGNEEDEKAHWKSMIEARKNAYQAAQESLDKKLDAGTISITTYYKKSKALADKWLKGRKSTEEEYADAIIQAQEKVVTAWNDNIAKTETIIKRRNLMNTWQEGGENEVAMWKKLLNELNKNQSAGLFKNTEDYYELRYELIEKIHEAEKKSWETQLDQIQDSSDAMSDLIDLVSDMMKQELETQIDGLERQRDLYDEILDTKLKSLKADKEANDYAKELEADTKELIDLQAKAAILSLDDSREGRAQYAKVIEEIRAKQEDINAKQDEHVYNATVDALEQRKETYDNAIEKKIGDIEALMAEAGPWLERVYERIEQTPPSTLLEQLKKYNYYHGTGMDQDVQKIFESSEKLLTSFNSNVPKILAYLENQERELNEKIEGSSGATGMSAAEMKQLRKDIQYSNTKTNTDKQNEALTRKVNDVLGPAWYDKDKNVIYMGQQGDKRITAGAYDIIQEMMTLNNTTGIGIETKKSQMKALLKKLQPLYSYEGAYLVWDKNNNASLYKKGGMEVFSSSITSVSSSGSKTSSTKKALKPGDLALKTETDRLTRQAQAITTFSDAIQGLQPSNLSNSSVISGVGQINLTVETPITIEGNADSSTVQQIKDVTDNIPNTTLDMLHQAMVKRGYSHPTAANAMRRS